MNFTSEELTMLRALATSFPNADAALAELAVLRAGLSLPAGSVHVVSDVHGEYKKLRHIINNASGTLRPLVERLFAERLNSGELRELLAVLYYPREAMELVTQRFADSTARQLWVEQTLRLQFEIVRELAGQYRRSHVVSLFPAAYEELFEELLQEPAQLCRQQYVETMINGLAQHGRDLAAVRAASRLVRNLSVAEIVVAGDLGDRGPRIDRVIEYLMQQPNVAIAWGNHDALWMGACLGQEALIATVARISLRYRRLSQLEEGYGLIMSPLEKLARTVYGEDPAERFRTRGTGLRDDLLMARMQKAAAILQFKLEGQLSRKYPEWEMEHRNLLHRIDHTKGTVEIVGRVHPMRDTYFPTIDRVDPYRLSGEEQACIDRLKQSFISSPVLWKHMSFVTRRGSMWLRRDQAVIFHGCVPVNEGGDLLSFKVDGREHSGRALFDAFTSVVRRAFRKGEAAGSDADWLWYLWTGPRSPLFGKDRMATFENYFIEDKDSRKEHKNPYFTLIHERDFCRRVSEGFGVMKNGLIVNGHVPVKVEKGEEPVKRSGAAVTIDGAFSEAYGDRGYTLILAADRIAVAEHHHFESISEAITSGADIVPKVSTLRLHEPPRTIKDTEEGERLHQDIAALQKLVLAYEEGFLDEQDPQIT
ncbi:MAG TPA: fructose-bisphosphatase class III [Pyrinomonadaceae bacterium]|nr:fructose-bisphosphatase class III [Pyrinomonadaceae bacterium]